MKPKPAPSRFPRPLRAAVLMGGVSEERPVSLRSGRAVARELLRLGHEVYPLVLSDRDLSVLDRVPAEAAFLALHGEFGEDGELQDLLEVRGLPYTGSGPQASRRAFDKRAAKAVFATAGLRVAAQVVVEGEVCLRARERVEELLDWPVVVKPSRQGSSIGVTIVRRPEDLDAALAQAVAHGGEVMVEAYIAGREFTVGVLGGRALPPVELAPAREFYDYQAKYGESGTRYLTLSAADPLCAPLMDAGLRAHQALDCQGATRVDMILPLAREGGRVATDLRPVVLELNTLPGMTETSLLPKAAMAAGWDFGELCERMLEDALARAGRTVAARLEEAV